MSYLEQVEQRFTTFSANYKLFQIWCPHNPPNTLVMKKGGWVISGENVTKLLNKEGEDESVRTSFEQKRTGSLYRSGVFSPGTVDPDDPNNSKSCAIM